MKKLLYNAERKFGRFAIKDLMMYISVTVAMVYVSGIFMPGLGLASKLTLWWPYVKIGQIWRVITFIFVPEASGVLSLILTLYFYYWLGSSIERAWGSFKFNIYYLIGIVGIVIGAAITGYGSVTSLNLTLLLAYAVLYPDTVIFMNFIFPVKVKYLAILYVVLALPAFVFGSFAQKVSFLITFLNFLLFFGRDFFIMFKDIVALVRHKIRNSGNRY